MTTFWGCRIVPFLALLFLVALCHSTSVHDYKCYSFSRRGKGAIIPYGDIVIEVGSSYKAFCLFNPDEVAVEEVYFEKEGKRIEDYTVVNSSAISVEVSHSEATEYKLQCLKGRNDFMCERSVYVGYKPQDVENFKCISMNWEKLNCSWSIPENPVKVTYTFTYVVPGFLLDSRECPQQGIRSNWCSWEGVDFISGRKDWVMTFTAKNSLQSEPVEFKHYINLFETVIPKMADKFEVHVLGPREVNLTWTLPHPIDVFSEGNVTHQVKYRNLLTNGSWKLFDQWEERPFRFSRKTFTRVIGALQPYVEYEFCVRLHTGTGEIRENMWSTPALVIKRTFAAQPAVTPLTTMGMFEVEEAKFHRDVYVNWQTVDPLFENGPNFGYDVRIFATTYGSPVSSPVFTKRSFHKFMKLEKHETYRFEIRPKNSIGLPEDLDVKSVMMLPKEAALLSTPRYFKVIAYPDANTTTYMVRWRLPHVHHQDRNIETVTLYWCRQTEYENRCQNKIGWEIVDEPNMNVKNLTGYDIYSRYMFGISVNSKNSSSGIKWSGCIARHGEQQPTLKKFNYTHIFSTEVKLKWELDCKAEAAQPNAFNISYCGLEENEKGCSDSEMYVRVDGESTVEYTVRNLHPYKNYSFNIASISDLGLGKWSPNVYVMTKPDKPSGPPQNMRAIDSGQTWSLLSWEPPLKSEQNGEIIKYIIREKIRDPLSLRVLGHTQQGNNLTFNATHLEPFTEYHFEVIACTNVNEQPSCGTAAAYVNVTTKIGAPGKIDSLFYDSDWLKWDFDECNGPSCFFLLNYTVNGTEYNTTTRAGQHAVSLEDLNASCSSKQGDIEVSLHALSRDEEGHQLSGPRKDMKISCSSKGTYYDEVSSNSNNPQIILVPVPVSNQYNTIFNLLRSPETFGKSYFSSRIAAVLSKRIGSIAFSNIPQARTNMPLNYESLGNNRRNEPQLVLNRNIEETVEGDVTGEQLLTEQGNERHRTWHRNGIDNQDESHYGSAGYSQGHSDWKWIPVIRQSSIMWLPLPYIKQGTDLHSHDTQIISPKRENLMSSRLSNVPKSAPSYSTVLGNSETQVDAYQSREDMNNDSFSHSHNANGQSTNAEYIKTESVRNNHSSPACPLLELMKAKGIEVTLNASNEEFEVNIKGQGNFLKLLQSVSFPVERPSTASVEVESKLVLQNNNTVVEESGALHNNSEATVNNSEAVN